MLALADENRRSLQFPACLLRGNGIVSGRHSLLDSIWDVCLNLGQGSRDILQSSGDLLPRFALETTLV